MRAWRMGAGRRQRQGHGLFADPAFAQVAVVLLVGGVAVLSRWLVGSALRPVEALTQTAVGIDRGLPHPRWQQGYRVADVLGDGVADRVLQPLDEHVVQVALELR